MYLHPKFERKKGVLPWLWITHWPLTFHIVQGLNKLWKIVIQEIYMACQHEDEPPMHSGKLANSSCWSGKEWRTKSPLHDGKKFWPKKNSMDRSVRLEIASRTNQGGCWICMQMPNFCYGIALLVDWPCRTTDLQNAKRKVRRATAAAVLVLWQVGYQASLQCRRRAHGDEPTKGTTGDGAARLVSLLSRARALTRVGRRRAWPEVALTRRTATGGPPGPRSGSGRTSARPPRADLPPPVICTTAAHGAQQSTSCDEGVAGVDDESTRPRRRCHRPFGRDQPGGGRSK